jgi:hypothetical protein
MALVKVDDICPLCKKKLAEGHAIYITKVNLTSDGRTGPGDGGMSFGGTYKATPKGKLRIKYLGSSKPRVCIHQECFDKKIAAILGGEK